MHVSRVLHGRCQHIITVLDIHQSVRYSGVLRVLVEEQEHADDVITGQGGEGVYITVEALLFIKVEGVGVGIPCRLPELLQVLVVLGRQRGQDTL